MPDSSEIDNIIHYQKSLARYTESRNDTKILHCIFKLFNMHVTMSHLEKTGIGRTVNSLRKLGGEVGDAANTLVKKWKDMVSKKNDDEKSEENPNEPDSTQESQSYKYESNSSHKYSDKSKNSDQKEILSRDDKYKHNKKDEYIDYKHKSNSEVKHKTDKRNTERRDRSSCDSNNVDSESGVSLDSDDSSMDSEELPTVTHSKENKYDKDRKYEHKHVEHKESASEKNLKHKRDSDKDRKHERSHSKEKRKHDSDNDRKRKRHDSCSNESNEQVSKHSSKYISKSSSKRKQDDSSSDEGIKTKVLKKSSSHKSSRESSHRDHKKESRSESDNEISSRDTHKSSSHKNKDSSSSREYKKENKSESVRKEHRSSSKSTSKPEKRKEEYSKDESSKSSDKNKKESSAKKDKERKPDTKEKSKSKSTAKSSSSGNTSSSTSSSKKMVDIGSESGTSFAEALGMLEPTSSKKSSSKKNKSSETNHKLNKSVPEKNVEEKSLPEKPSKRDKIDIMIPPPPKNDIDLNIASLLPPITPNYKPIGNPFFESCNTRNRIMNDDEALSLVMSQKNQRTKVYSGNKSFYGTVPTLFELCIRILQDNIDALEYTGGVPYVILKPVLDKATPDQLFMLEHHNPYLIDDTDEIWLFHCNKEFRNKKREELESWREMYMRCLDEREAKLKALTENIKLAQDKSVPVRQTKLAYVDSVVKPPRDVIRRQAKSGVDKKPIVTPSSRLSTLAVSGGAGQVSVPNPVKASSSGGSSAAMKPKKAPLMQKTLAFLKGNRFRR